MCSRKSYSRFSSMSRASTNAPDEHLFGWLKTVAQNKFHDQSRSPRLEGEAPGGSSAQRLLAQVPDGPRSRAPMPIIRGRGDDRPLDREAVRRLEGAGPWRQLGAAVAGPGPRQGRAEAAAADNPRGDDRPLDREAVRRAHAQVEEQTWNAFFRSVVDELSAEEVAAELGMTVNAVYKAKDRVKRLAREAGRPWRVTVPPSH